LLTVSDLHRPGMPHVSFSLAAGTFLALMGPSGSGKTLLLRALADLDPSEGAVLFEGQNKMDIPAPEWRRQIAYVAAEPGWWADTPAAHFRNWSDAQPLVEALLLSPDIGDAPITRLSTGERQRLALIRALVEAPKVLLLDEPTGPLDTTATEAVEAVLRQRADAGTSILLSTHDAAQSARLAVEILHITGGRAEIEPV
jgi:putative ABC transport system ATP-binding protein